jgi:hypothetical protein
MTDIDATQDLNAPPAHRLGAVDYRLQIPALSLAGYVRMQRVLLLPQPGGPGRTRSRWSSWRSLILGVVVGIVLGVMASAYDWTAELYVGIDDSDAGWLVGGRGVLVLAFMIAAVTTLCGIIALQRAQARILARVHAAGGELFGAHDLTIGDGGIFLHNVARTTFVPWSAVTRVVQDRDGIFIVADHVSAFWITENVLAALPDRAAFLASLERRMAEHPRADRTPA